MLILVVFSYMIQIYQEIEMMKIIIWSYKIYPNSTIYIYIRNKYIIIYHCDLRLDAYCIGNHYLVFNANLTNIKNRILSNYCTVLPYDEYVYGLINHYLVNMICNAQYIIIKILYQLPLFAIFFRCVIA